MVEADALKRVLHAKMRPPFLTHAYLGRRSRARYLINLLSREARLDSLAAGGRPQGQLPSSDGSLRDPGSG